MAVAQARGRVIVSYAHFPHERVTGVDTVLPGFYRERYRSRQACLTRGQIALTHLAHEFAKRGAGTWQISLLALPRRIRPSSVQGLTCGRITPCATSGTRYSARTPVTTPTRRRWQARTRGWPRSS